MRNPHGSPPRVPSKYDKHAIDWLGERWYVDDACAAVGIHPNTYYGRRKSRTVAQSLEPTKRQRRTAVAMPTVADLMEAVAVLTARVEALEAATRAT